MGNLAKLFIFPLVYKHSTLISCLYNIKFHNLSKIIPLFEYNEDENEKEEYAMHKDVFNKAVLNEFMAKPSHVWKKVRQALILFFSSLEDNDENTLFIEARKMMQSKLVCLANTK